MLSLEAVDVGGGERIKRQFLALPLGSWDFNHVSRRDHYCSRDSSIHKFSGNFYEQ